MLLGAVSTPVFPQIMARVGIVTQYSTGAHALGRHTYPYMLYMYIYTSLSIYT